MVRLLRILRALPLVLISPLIWAISILAIALTDLFGRIRARIPASSNRPSGSAASVVIPNWNGRDLLEKYLPSVEAALSGSPDHEIIVVDNGSSDGSTAFLRERFPRVKVLALDRNLGFGGGSNAGFRAAKNDIVVLLNSDMRVDAGFLAPLLAGFTDGQVFAVSCQIFFSDPAKLREETGLTQGWWQDGNLRVRHRIDEGVTGLYPCFYGGGGSCAFDRRKFLELGGFDPLLAPFYLEDTDLGYMAWKRGWKVLYQPASKVFHEHRGTIGKRFREEQIQAVLKKNFILFTWKNIHDWRKLAAHFFFTWAGALLSVPFGDEPERPNLLGIWRAFLQLPQAMRSRWRARQLATIHDDEAFRGPMGGYFRDRFEIPAPRPERLRVLLVSPYPICPPVHGGGVFMYQTLRELAKLAEVHVIVLLDYHDQIADNLELEKFCASVEFIIRMQGEHGSSFSILPHAVREFANEDLAWLIHRQIYERKIDVVQLEYTNMGQYAEPFERIATALFEHDIYFQSIGRGLGQVTGPLAKIIARLEYLRALRYELHMLPRCDQVQVCTMENREYLASFVPHVRSRIQEGLRAGIDTSRYEFRACGREPCTMLFLGSFRHLPNFAALDWFVHRVLPRILERRPEARLIVVGSDPPPPHVYGDFPNAIEVVGFVEDIRTVLERYAVFVCPILSGSGVRVKLLEAFASGMPAVSTRIGAEGLARQDGEFCFLADDPHEFAERVLLLFDESDKAAAMAGRARAEVVGNWDMAKITRSLCESYAEIVQEKRNRR
jgi:GT2 family glycosyltransferase/glycosyltransferase involved in cell wall biosynthesis